MYHPMIEKAAKDLTRARFAWFWYNSEEIFHFTQEDMDKKMLRYANEGYTHIITFSCTHFRWSFRPWWKEIHACLAKIVKSAHKHGIKVIEHHSSNLTYYPNEIFLDTIRRELNDWNCDVDKDFPGFFDFNMDWSQEHMQWCQQDAVTRKPMFGTYAGHCRCPNYEGYMEGYLKYLEDVYATGVDGIMTDDMYAFYARHEDENGKVRYINRSCGCPNCRKLYEEMTGYPFPKPEEWDNWFGRMDDPSFIAFLKFRKATFLKFHTRVKEHYESLGLKLFRPNYNAAAFVANHAFGADEFLPALDLFFQECCYGYVIRYSWPRFLFEQHVIAGRCKNGIPHMMMFYASRKDSLRFVYGICRIAGAMLTNTCHGDNPYIGEEVLRDFEDANADYIFGTQDMSYVTFIDSEDNRSYSAGFHENRTAFWMQGSLLRNIPCRMQSIEKETWETPIVVLNEVRLLTEEQIARLKKYAENGGTLVLTGIVGEQDGNSRFRSEKELQELWGIDLYNDEDPDSYRIYPLGKGRICRVGYNFGYPGGRELNYQRFVYDERRRKRNYISHKEELLATPAGRFHSGKQAICKLADDYNLYSRNAPYYDKIVALFEELAGDKISCKSILPDLVLAKPFFAPAKKSVVIQLLNAADTLPKHLDDPISHDDVIPFPEWKGTDGSFILALPGGVAGEKAEFCPVEGENTVLALEKLPDGRVKVTLPAGILKDCGFICIR